jgi:hypothetical protein
MGNLKSQLRSYRSTVTSHIKMVRSSSPSTCVSLSYTIKSLNSFDLRTKSSFMHYYNALPSPYHHRLEEKSIDNLGFALHTCLEYEEQLERTGLPQGELVKQTNMSALLQLVQDMNNHMIVYE